MYKIVIVESPYAGEIERNLIYVRRAMRDCFMRHEIPFASHALYTQPGVLDDNNPVERSLGIKAGFAFWSIAELMAIYEDYGISPGMLDALTLFKNKGKIEYRKIGLNT